MSTCTTKPPWGRTVEKCWLAVTVQQIIPLCFKHSAQAAEIFRGIWPSLACQRLMAYNSVSAAKIPKCIGQSVCVCQLRMFQSLPPDQPGVQCPLHWHGAGTHPLRHPAALQGQHGSDTATLPQDWVCSFTSLLGATKEQELTSVDYWFIGSTTDHASM